MDRSGKRRATSCRIRCSVDVEARVGRVFEEWDRLEQLPRWMEGPRRIRRIDDRRYLWEADVFGRQVIWEAEIVIRDPGKRIGWESRRGRKNSGEVSFEALPGGRSRVTVDLTFRPRGLVERLTARVGLLERRIRGDLLSFGDHMREIGRTEGGGAQSER